MVCRFIPRRALARRLKVLFLAGFIFAVFHFLVIGIEYEAGIYKPEEEILHRVKRLSTQSPKSINAEPFKARIVIAKVCFQSNLTCGHCCVVLKYFKSTDTL